MPAFISFLPSVVVVVVVVVAAEGGRQQDLNRSPLLAEAQLIPIIYGTVTDSGMIRKPDRDRKFHSFRINSP